MHVPVPLMGAAGVKRLIAVTGFGVGDSRVAIDILPRLPFGLVVGRAYDDKDAQELRIGSSSLAPTPVSLGLPTSGAAKGRYTVLAEHRRGEMA